MQRRLYDDDGGGGGACADNNLMPFVHAHKRTRTHVHYSAHDVLTKPPAELTGRPAATGRNRVFGGRHPVQAAAAVAVAPTGRALVAARGHRRRSRSRTVQSTDDAATVRAFAAADEYHRLLIGNKTFLLCFYALR